MVFVDSVSENTHIEEKFPALERLVGKNMQTYPVGDFLIRIKNASLANKKEVEVFSSKFVKEVAKTLKEEGFLDTVEEKKGKIKVTLAFSHKKPVVMDIKLISRPGLRIYKSVDDLEKIKRPTIFLISTPKGILSSKKAIKQRMGGEVLAEIL
ncbi:MAG: 30S ribosomal protein S8 [Patescibacteria group bacterium]